jgi:hypothetical protein
LIHLLPQDKIDRLIKLGLLTQEAVDAARRELGVSRKQEKELRAIIKAQREIERYTSRPVTRYSKRELKRLMESYPGAPSEGTTVRKGRGGVWRQKTRFPK